MLLNLACWAVMSATLFALGWLGKKGADWVWGAGTVRGLDEILATGLMLAAAYAEAASFFGGVGGAAAGVLLAVAAAVLWRWRGEIAACAAEGWRAAPKGKVWVALWGCVALLVLVEGHFSSLPRYYFDTGNYHVPAIRWIEEYGVVKGLGNLHTRFAYNSASLCLQALYSFSWLVGRPLHAVNGFLWLFAVAFCVGGLVRDGREGRAGLSTAFRAALLGLVAPRGASVAAPNTDFMPLFLAGYVFIKWCERAERNDRGGRGHAVLGLLAVFAPSVKLSLGALTLFAVMAALGMIRERDWKGLAAFSAAGAAVVAPFLGRNVVLSGYLLYPFPALDLFGVDWKIPGIVALSDAVAIQLCARMPEGWGYLQNLDGPLVWIPRWWAGLSLANRAVLGAGALGYAVCGIGLLAGRRGDAGRRTATEVWCVAAAGFLYLLAGAPSFRFGDWWIVSGAAMGGWWVLRWALGKTSGRVRNRAVKAWGGLAVAGCACFVAAGVLFSCRVAGAEVFSGAHWSVPADYPDESATQAWAELGGRRFYYCKRTPAGPLDGGLNGYRGFPGTECRTTLERIEMRGSGLGDGFRPSPLCRDRAYDFQGKLLEDGEVEALTGGALRGRKRK